MSNTKPSISQQQQKKETKKSGISQYVKQEQWVETKKRLIELILYLTAQSIKILASHN